MNSVFPAVKKDLPFDTPRDFVAISNFFLSSNILVVNPSVPAHSIAEFMTLLKAKPNEYSFASSGVGSSIHLSGELFKQMAGVEMVHVPYRGSGPAIADLLAGRVQLMFDNLASSWLVYVKTGQLRALGAHEPRARSARARGFLLSPRRFRVSTPRHGAGFCSRAGKNTAGNASRRSQPPFSVQSICLMCLTNLEIVGALPVGDTPEHFSQFLRTDIEKWRIVVEKAGVKSEE